MLDIIIDKLRTLYDQISDLKKTNRELSDNALRSVSTALNETLFYYKSLDRGSPRNLETEAQLVKYWSAAAIPMRHIDSQFAEICEYKSDYWLNPESWSPEKVKEFQIGLYDVRSKYRMKLRRVSYMTKAG